MRCTTCGHAEIRNHGEYGIRPCSYCGQYHCQKCRDRKVCQPADHVFGFIVLLVIAAVATFAAVVEFWPHR